jgi:hypothetical protein
MEKEYLFIYIFFIRLILKKEGNRSLYPNHQTSPRRIKLRVVWNEWIFSSYSNSFSI